MSDAPSGNAHTPAARQVERGVIRGLYDGGFAPGQRLVESDLMTRFGVSRSTVREAIRRLESVGVVEVSPFRGAQIRQLAANEASDMLLVVEYCMGLAARQAAARLGAAANRQIFEKAWAELRQFGAQPEGFEQIRARDRFYAAITKMSGNRELARIIPSLQVHLIRRLYTVPQADRFDDYKRIAEAILAGDETAAEAAMRAHIGRSLRQVLQRQAASVG